jgi:hypothetical protein
MLLWLSLTGDEQDPAEDAPQAGPSVAPSSEPSSSPTEEESSRVTARELADFAETYVPTAVDDRDAAWQMLTPQFQSQSGGRSGYESWWSQFESADARNVSADPEAMTVSYTVDYVYKDGRRQSDDVTLQLVEEGGKLLIAGES